MKVYKLFIADNTLIIQDIFMIFKSYDCIFPMYLYYFKFLIVIKDIICVYKISCLSATIKYDFKKVIHP